MCAVIGSACSTPTAVDDQEAAEKAADFWVIGYHPWWMPDAWPTYDLSVVSKVFFFDIAVREDGTFAQQSGGPERWPGVAGGLRARGTAVVPTFSVLDAATFNAVFADPARTQTLRRNIVGLVEQSGAGGVHLDFEVFDPVAPYVRRAFTAFVRDVRRDLDVLRPGLFLSAFTLALDVHDAYDEAALAESADYLVVQGYDLHWAGDRQAGPVAPLDGWGGKNWNTIVDRYLGLQVPRRKIVMAVPYYGYEWPTTSETIGAATRGTGIFTTYGQLSAGDVAGFVSARQRAETFGSRRDPASGSPYYVYQDSTGWHQGWYEDPESLRAKYEFVKQKNLGGVAIFPLAYGDPSLDAVLRDAFGGRAAVVELAARP